MTNGTSSSTSNGVEVTFLPPISSGAIPTTSTTSGSQDQGQMAGVRVVVGTGGDGGEFRVPVAPAPRQVHSQQASFNAQLNVSFLGGILSYLLLHILFLFLIPPPTLPVIIIVVIIITPFSYYFCYYFFPPFLPLTPF